MRPGELASASTATLAREFHSRLHIGRAALRALPDATADAPDALRNATVEQCECAACARANASRLPTSHGQYAPSTFGQLVHSDVMGPFKPSHYGGLRYAITFIDDHSRYTSVYFMRTKDEAPLMLKRFTADCSAFLLRSGRTSACTIRTDNGGEYLSDEWADVCESDGTRHQTSNPYNPRQNGISEITNRSLCRIARAALSESGLSLSLWPEALQHAATVLNRTPHSTLGPATTPYERATGNKPRIGHIMPFGRRAYVLKPKVARTHKLDERGYEGVNLGCSRTSPGWIIHVPNIGKVTSSDVTWGRDFPHAADPTSRLDPSVSSQADAPIAAPPAAARVTKPVAPPPSPPPHDLPRGTRIEIYFDGKHYPAGWYAATVLGSTVTKNGKTRVTSIRYDVADHAGKTDYGHNLDKEQFRLMATPTATADANDDDDDDAAAPAPAPTPAPAPAPAATSGYNLRSRAVPAPPARGGTDDDEKADDENAGGDGLSATGMVCSAIAIGMVCSAISASLANQGDIGYMLLSKKHGAKPKLLSKAATTKEEINKWDKAYTKEANNHLNNGSIELIDAKDVPAGRKIIGSTTIEKEKRDGTAKVRMCTQGFSQIEGVDFNDTFAPTCRMSSLRLLCAIAAFFGANSLTRVDFEAAYLQGHLPPDEICYMRMPPGFAEHLPDHLSAIGSDGRPKICRVVKPIYGMRQAGFSWNSTLNEWLIDPAKGGFTRCTADPCIYVKREEDGRTIICACYVDDLTCASNDPAYRDAFVSKLAGSFNITDEGELADIVNVQVKPNADGTITLHQQAYIEKLANTYLGDGFNRVKHKNPASSDLPSLVEAALSATEPIDPERTKSYQSLVGAILYCSISTRPDISYATGMLCRAMSKPTPELFAAAERVLLYLEGTKELGITFDAGDAQSIKLSGMSDSDWATQHSTSGYIFSVFNGAVSWLSKKQPVIALSSTEAEIMAASIAGSEAVSLRSLLSEMGFKQDEPTELRVDNKGAVFTAKYHGAGHSKLKHVERRHLWIRELVQDGKLNVSFIRTDDNVSDLFTKPLPTRRFLLLRDLAMNIKSRRAAFV